MKEHMQNGAKPLFDVGKKKSESHPNLASPRRNIFEDYSTVGCRRTRGPPSQHGVVLNFLNLSQLTFLLCDQTGVHENSIKGDFCTQFPNSLLSINFQPGMLFKKLETPAWPYFTAF